MIGIVMKYYFPLLNPTRDDLPDMGAGDDDYIERATEYCRAEAQKLVTNSVFHFFPRTVDGQVSLRVLPRVQMHLTKFHELDNVCEVCSSRAEGRCIGTLVPERGPERTPSFGRRL